MAEFNIESDAIDVEQIMGQIRARIDEKRGVDYTEEQIRELANVKLDRFLDPKNVRSGMVKLYQKQLREKRESLLQAEKTLAFEFDPEIIYRSTPGLRGQILYRVRKLLNPLLKFFFNPAPIVHALTIQQQINERMTQMVKTQVEFIEIAALNYEIMNNLVVEMTRLSIEMKNHKMRVESVAGRLDFDERRARALEKVVQYREGASAPSRGSEDQAPEKRRRRRRRGRRRPSTGSPGGETTAATDATESQTGESEPTSEAEPSGDVVRPASAATPASEDAPPTPAATENGPASERSTPSAPEGEPTDR